MYLKSLEIQGFKSFPDKTTLTFGEELTAIVGPNGSGKSNISDAIRWVMGEQSTKTLRGGKMEDVIFDGTQKRKGMGFAEVSLIIDNTAHLFDMEESEIMITRRYYRSGESEYYINRRSVRLKDVNELLMDTGLGRDGYAMIGQGRIDEILSVKSTDRREIFEEAAGISRYRHRKEEAERKLERTEENLVRINDKIEELALQVEPLKEQSEKAARFLGLRDELRSLEVSVWLEQLDRARTEAEEVSAEYETALQGKEELQGEVESLYQQAEDCTGQMQEKDIRRDALREELNAIENEAAECENAASLMRNTIENNLENAERVRAELEDTEKRAGSVRGQIEAGRAHMQQLSEQSDALRDEMEQREDQVRELDENVGTLAREEEELRRQVEAGNASEAEARSLLSALAAAAQELLDRDQAISRDLLSLEEKKRQAEEQARSVLEQLENARVESEELDNVIAGHTVRLEQRRRKAEEAEKTQTELNMKENRLNERIRLLAEMEKLHEGFSKAVKTVMSGAEKGMLRGIRGPVAELLRVPDPYTTAIETALGGAMQHVVTDSDASAKAAIRFLQNGDGGRATFLPIPSMQSSRFRDTGALSEEGILGIAENLIEFDEEYRPVVSNLLGRVLIAEDLDSATAVSRKYGSRFKVVTLDGQVLNAGGSMTGGSAGKNAGIISRANELKRLRGQEEEIRQELAEADETLKKTRTEADAAARELEDAAARKREKEDQILTIRERLTACEAQSAELDARDGALREESRQIRERSERNEEDARKARERVEELKGTAAALHEQEEGNRQGQKDLREQREGLLSEQAATEARLDALREEQSRLEESVGELERLQQGIESDRETRDNLAAQLQRTNEDLEAQIREKNETAEKLRGSCREKEEELETLNRERLDLEALRTRAEKESREKNGKLLDMERNVSALEQKKTSATMEERQILDKLWDTYELSHEAALQQRVEIENMKKAQRRINELKREISALGNINLDAIDQYQQVSERYEYLTGQRDDVGKSKKELEGIISKLTAEMKDIFTTQLDLIQKEFSQTFRDLFGGGRAELEIEDPEDVLGSGIEIRAQPPGKALKTISLLSGGERAFVAISLYFAILKVRPTPFCVMDEIEAALDDANVVRFARYMRKLADKTQFIVITHRRGTMEEADALYGVTMQEQGVSRILTINLNEMDRQLKLS